MTRTRHVVVLNHFAVPPGQPGGTRHVELFGKLEGWTHAIVAARRNLTTGRRQAAEPGFVPVWVLPYRGNGVTRVLNWASYAVTATVATLRGPRPDVVYASSPHLLAGLAGWVVARVRGARFVLEVRDLWPRVLLDLGRVTESSPVYRLLAALERFLYRRAEHIVVLATGTRRVLEGMGVPPGKISYVPNAADPQDFAPSDCRERLRAAYGFTRTTVVYAGAHGPANGLDMVLDAAAKVGDLDLDIVLVGDGVEKQRLIRRAQIEGLANVRFLPPVPKTAVPDLLHAADLGLHVLADVPLFQGCVSPNKVFDYLAAGLPVLTNSPGVVGELVEGARGGWAVTPHGIADGLREAMEVGPETLVARGTLGRGWIARHQGRRAMAIRLAGVLDGSGEGSG